MANYYLNIFQKDEKQRPLLDTALLNFRKCIGVYQKHGGKMVFRNILPVVALNVATLYQQYPVGNHTKDSVDRYVDISIKSSSAAAQSGIVSACYGMMAEYEMGRGNYKKAEEILLAGLAIMHEADSIKAKQTQEQGPEKTRENGREARRL